MGLYIVANVDGNVISSTDGLNWSEAFDTGINIGKFAIGPEKIVYTRCDVQKEMDCGTGLYYSSVWNQTPVLAQGTENYYFNEVHYLGGKFVAVGYIEASPNTSPAYAYSENGVNWNIGQIDPAYEEEVGDGNDMQFNDVGYNGIGYFIISKVAGEGLAGGFYTTDLSQELNDDNFVTIENFPVDANQLVYPNDLQGGENFGAWSVFSDDKKTWYSTFNEDPSQPWSFVEGLDLSELLQFSTGLFDSDSDMSDLNIIDATIGVLDGYIVWMLSTSQGQIIWWPHVPAGPFVSIPNPYTCTVASIENLNPLEVNLSGTNIPEDNERIVIEESAGLTDLNGTYFVESLGSGNYRLHDDVGLESTIDASGWVGSYTNGSATAKLSKGAPIDAIGYGDGKFFAGNNDEEVFVCSSLNIGGEDSGDLIWTKVDDKNNVYTYWNDMEYGDFSGCVQQNYKLNLTPQNPDIIHNYKYTGEGNMDTSVVIDSDGNRVSIQRTGYFEVVDNCGNRKVVSIKDGDNFNNIANLPSLD
jgi:hypothetical protein